MADVWEKDLAQKSSLTTSDFIRVVGSDNVSYKQAISGFMGTIGVDKMVNGATNPSVSSFAELKESAFYTIGNAPNYSDAPVTGYGLLCVFNGGTYRTQTYYAFHSGETYYRISTNSGSTWNTWTKQPTRAEVDALNSNALQVAHGSGITEVAIGAYSNYSNLIFTFPNSSVTQFVFYNTGRVAILRKKADGTWGSETQIRPAD